MLVDTRLIAKYAAEDLLYQVTNNTSRRLYNYQTAIVYRMQEMERHAGSVPAEMIFGGPHGSAADRRVALQNGRFAERNLVRTKPQTGILAAATGTGKTSIIIELLARPEVPRTNKVVRHTCLGPVFLEQVFLPIDFVVVPFKLAKQWSDDLKTLGQHVHYTIIVDQAGVASFAEILSYYLAGDNVTMPKHVLITNTMWAVLLNVNFAPLQTEYVRLDGKMENAENVEETSGKDESIASSSSSMYGENRQPKRKCTDERQKKQKRQKTTAETCDNDDDDDDDDDEDDDNEDDEVEEDMDSEDVDVDMSCANNFESRTFPHMFRARRVIIDECDSLNFKMVWSDFLWVVSATFDTFFNKCVKGGSGATTHSLLGELKKATYYYTYKQLCALFTIRVSKKAFLRAIPKNSLPPFTSQSITYEAPLPQRIEKYVDYQFLSPETWAILKKELFSYIATTSSNSINIVFYAANDSEFEKNILLTDLNGVSDENTQYYLVNTAKCLGGKNIQTVLKTEPSKNKKRIVLVMNARYVAEGLNLQIANNTVIVNYMSERIFKQVLGRVQRPVRSGALHVVRLWAPDARLLVLAKEVAKDTKRSDSLRQTYDSEKLIMSQPWTQENETLIRDAFGQMNSQTW